jgi:hypothetical protein
VQNRRSPENQSPCAGTRDLIHINELTPTTLILVQHRGNQGGYNASSGSSAETPPVAFCAHSSVV